MNFQINEKKIYSQAGEDGIIQSIFSNINSYNRVCVEFGEKGNGGNTRFLREKKKWKSILFDSDPISGISNKEFITAGNINDIFLKYKVPKIFDLLSIDIDGNDYWVWKALDDNRFRPRVVIMEYNCNFPIIESKTIEYNEKHVFNRTVYYGATLSALKKIGESKGYNLVYISSFLNLFFIDNKIVKEGLDVEKHFIYPMDIKKEFMKWNMRCPSWFDEKNNCYKKDNLNRPWIDV